MIKTFKCKKTEKIFNRHSIKAFQSIERIALRKLRMINASISINDLRVPPANHLEALLGDRKEQHSIRINKQYRICFSFREGNAYDVEITDYH